MAQLIRGRVVLHEQACRRAAKLRHLSERARQALALAARGEHTLTTVLRGMRAGLELRQECHAALEAVRTC